MHLSARAPPGWTPCAPRTVTLDTDPTALPTDLGAGRLPVAPQRGRFRVRLVDDGGRTGLTPAPRVRPCGPPAETPAYNPVRGRAPGAETPQAAARAGDAAGAGCSASASRAVSVARARATRERTVPTGQPLSSAASA
jgi:hypothetical protein